MIRKHTPLKPIGRPCRIDGCDETAWKSKYTLCNKHYHRIKKYNDPNADFRLKPGEHPK